MKHTLALGLAIAGVTTLNLNAEAQIEEAPPVATTMETVDGGMETLKDPQPQVALPEYFKQQRFGHSIPALDLHGKFIILETSAGNFASFITRIVENDGRPELRLLGFQLFGPRGDKWAARQQTILKSSQTYDFDTFAYDERALDDIHWEALSDDVYQLSLRNGTTATTRDVGVVSVLAADMSLRGQSNVINFGSFVQAHKYQIPIDGNKELTIGGPGSPVYLHASVNLPHNSTLLGFEAFFDDLSREEDVEFGFSSFHQFADESKTYTMRYGNNPSAYFSTMGYNKDQVALSDYVVHDKVDAVNKSYSITVSWVTPPEGSGPIRFHNFRAFYIKNK